MISEETIKRENVSSVEWRFEQWLEEVRINGNERTEIESIVNELKGLILKI